MLFSVDAYVHVSIHLNVDTYVHIGLGVGRPIVPMDEGELSTPSLTDTPLRLVRIIRK